VYSPLKTNEVKMQNNIQLGLGRHMIPIPAFMWTRLVAQNVKNAEANLGFMTTDHHRVRDLAVSRMPGSRGPITPELIAARLGLPLEKVIQLLDDMEKRMTFLYRGGGSAVSWAYPMTADQTPHQVEFDSGEQIHAA
jgi:hypothetical protein